VEAIAPGTPIVAISTIDRRGMDDLLDLLEPRRTIALIGSSGVGKSTLVNALAGEALLAVREVRFDDARGRHTTSRRQLVRLPGGALILDTPGMRELGLVDDGGLGGHSRISTSSPPDAASRTVAGVEPLRGHEAILDGSLPSSDWTAGASWSARLAAPGPTRIRAPGPRSDGGTAP
jgi:hypothetical protein